MANSVDSINKKDSDASSFELVILGAGVFGAMLALEASQRGLKTLLLEQSDFGSLSSANSLKTIHGGLRYLQQVDLKSSFLSSQERSNWLRMQPGMIRPLKCMLPTTSSFMKSPLVVGSGMLCYNLLTLGRNRGLPPESSIPPARLANRQVLNESLPRMDTAGLKGAGIWYDAQAVNTERSVLETCLAAKRRGAKILNYTQVNGLKRISQGYKVETSSGIFSTRYIADCTGAHAYLEKTGIESILGKPVEPNQKDRDLTYVKAANLVIKRTLSECAFGFKTKFDSGSERLLFSAPWKPHVGSENYTLIGTWYFEVESDVAQKLSRAELNMCLNELNGAFSDHSFTLGDIVQTHVGFLPASKEKISSKGADESLVKTEKFLDLGNHHQDLDGLFILKGTKYTLARLGAETAIDYVDEKYNLGLLSSMSANTPLWSLDSDTQQDLMNAGLSQIQARFVRDQFASSVSEILSICERDNSYCQGVPGAEYCCIAVFEHVINQELVVTLVDLLVRRIPIGSAECPANTTIHFALDRLSTEHQWDQARWELEEQSLRLYYIKLDDQNE